MEKITACPDWQQQRSEDGEFRHPVFFENYTDDAQYKGLVKEAKLVIDGWYLGDGYPRQEETRLRAIYDGFGLGGVYDSIREWNPNPASLEESDDPEKLAQWFILWICDTDEGPYVCWARNMTPEEESTNED